MPYKVYIKSKDQRDNRENTKNFDEHSIFESIIEINCNIKTFDSSKYDLK